MENKKAIDRDKLEHAFRYISKNYTAFSKAFISLSKFKDIYGFDFGKNE